MTKQILASFLTILCFSAYAQFPYMVEKDGETHIDKEKYQEYLRTHPYATREPLLKEDLKKMDKRDRPDLAYEHDWLTTQDPRTGKIEWQRLVPILDQAHKASTQVLTVAPGGSTSNQWTERGPNNIGGRVRAMMFDPTDITNKKVYAGGVGGGLWFTTDITSTSTSWVAVNDFWANLAVSAIAYDPTSTSTWYVGTGEGYGNADAIRGAGIWKSTNAGTSWTQLTATSPATTSNFRYIMDVVVTSTGRLVVAASGGLYTSDNGGTSFTRRQSSSYFSDIEIAANGDLYAGTRYSGRLYKSTNNGTSWTQITNLGGSPDRIEIACAPSDSNTVYVVASGGSGNQDVELFKKSTNAGSTWSNVTIPVYASNSSNHFTRRQAWYDLILWVHPTNANLVVAGGVDLHRTTNGGTTWSPVSYWNTSQFPLPEVHADQHMILSRPGNNNEVIIGNDGGVYYSTNLGNSSATPTYSHTVKNFNVTQYYSCALHPTASSNVILGGTQDNGSLRNNTAGIGAATEVTGGDGAFCFIDQNSSNVFITSYVYNNWRVSTNGGSSFTYLTSDNTGSFINPADYDDNLNILYSARNSNDLKRITNIGGTNSIGTITLSGMSSRATHIRVSPYTTSSTTLFVGSGGDVYRVTNANSTPVLTSISSSSFPAGTISCIEIGASESELLVTFSNYGVNSVWYTSNGGTTWVSKEGNLPDMPVRWALFNPKNRDEVILATEVGVWATSDIGATSPTWTASNQGLANTRVDMLQYRSSDSLILAATHGRGMFTGRFEAPVTNSPVASFVSSRDTVCLNDTVTFTSTSTNNPTTYAWTIPGGTPSSGTSSSVTTSFATSGPKTVSLKVTNSFGNDSTAQVAVFVEANPTVTMGNIGPFCVSDPMQVLTQGSPSGGVYSGTGVSGIMFNPALAGVGNHVITYTYTTSNGCVGSANTTVAVTSTPSVSVTSVPNQCENAAPFTLTNGSPTGGTYTGVGVSSGVFDPGAAGVGSHTIVYQFGSPTCNDTASFVIVVDSAPSVNLTTIGPFCTTDPSQTLTQGTPSGGVYSGTGVSGNNFSPSTAGVGNHTVKYVVAYSNGCSDSATTSVSVTSGFSVSASAVPNQCANGAPITLSNGSPTGGTYSGPGVSGNTFSPSAVGPGVHTLQYAMGTGSCRDSATFTIQVDSVPNVTLAAIGPFCTSDSNQTLTQGSPSGGTYSGTGVSGGVFSPSTAGAGSFTIFYLYIGSNGCSDTVSTTVVVSTGTAPTLGSFNDVCEGSAAFSLTGGSPTGGTYSGPGVSGGMFDPSVAGVGTHTISYTHSSACGAAATSTITVQANPVLTLSGDTGICSGSSVGISASGASTYSWTPASSLSSSTAANPVASPTTTTTYMVTGTSTLGCSSMDSLVVTVNALPTVNAGADDSVCAGSVYQLQASGGLTYSWSPASGLSATNIANPTATITSNQSYVVVGTDRNGCSDMDTINLSVIAAPSVSQAPIPDVCLSGAPFTLAGGTPSGGVYSGPGVSNGTFDPSAAGLGTHSIVYTVSNGKCSASDTVSVNVTSSPTITWGIAFEYCENDSSVIPVASPVGGTFSGSAFSNGMIRPKDLLAGNYQIVYNYADTSGCTAQDVKEVVIHPAYIDSIQGVFNAIINRTYNYSVNPINGAAYQWTLTGGTFLSQTSNTVTVRWGGGPSGMLKVVQINQFGCMDSTSESVLVNPLSEKEFVLGDNTLRVYPNPASDYLNIKLSSILQESQYEYAIISLEGKQVLLGEFYSSAQQEEVRIDLGEIPNGLYFLQVVQGSESMSIPIVVGQ